MSTVWSGEIVKLLPFDQYDVQIFVIFVREQWVKFVLVRSVRPFYFTL